MGLTKIAPSLSKADNGLPTPIISCTRSRTAQCVSLCVCVCVYSEHHSALPDVSPSIVAGYWEGVLSRDLQGEQVQINYKGGVEWWWG